MPESAKRGPIDRASSARLLGGVLQVVQDFRLLRPLFPREHRAATDPGILVASDPPGPADPGQQQTPAET